MGDDLFLWKNYRNWRVSEPYRSTCGDVAHVYGVSLCSDDAPIHTRIFVPLHGGVPDLFEQNVQYLADCLNAAHTRDDAEHLGQRPEDLK